MKTVIAVHKIGTSDPDAPLVHTGRYDAEGNAILKKQTLSILPGSFFEPRSEQELGHLLELGAVRLPTEAELLMHEKEQGK